MKKAAGPTNLEREYTLTSRSRCVYRYRLIVAFTGSLSNAEFCGISKTLYGRPFMLSGYCQPYAWRSRIFGDNRCIENSISCVPSND